MERNGNSTTVPDEFLRKGRMKSKNVNRASRKADDNENLANGR